MCAAGGAITSNHPRPDLIPGSGCGLHLAHEFVSTCVSGSTQHRHRPGRLLLAHQAGLGLAPAQVTAQPVALVVGRNRHIHRGDVMRRV